MTAHRPKPSHPWRASGTLRAARPPFREKRNPRPARAVLAEIERRVAAAAVGAQPAEECSWCSGTGRIKEVEGVPEIVDVICESCSGSGTFKEEVPS